MADHRERFEQYLEENGAHAPFDDFFVQQPFVIAERQQLDADEAEVYCETPKWYEDNEDIQRFYGFYGVKPVVSHVPGCEGFGYIVFPGTLASRIEALFEDEVQAIKAVRVGLDDFFKGMFYENWGTTLGIPESDRHLFEW